MTTEASDVQNRKLSGSFKLTRVGVTDVKKPVHIKRPHRVVELTTIIDIFVDLPSTIKGSHMSRNIEVINEVLDNSIREPCDSLEHLAELICGHLLERHEYAGTAEVRISADYFLERSSASGKTSLEPYRLMGMATGTRNGTITKRVGVEVIGMTACPCAMEKVRDVFVERTGEGEGPLTSLPVITHNQRNRTTLMLEVPAGETVEADELVELVESCQSAGTVGILKRDDEAALVIAAHEHPQFVEDVVRDILGKLLEKYPGLPDDVKVTVRSESEESIHKHNAFAERVTTVGELRS